MILTKGIYFQKTTKFSSDVSSILFETLFVIVFDLQGDLQCMLLHSLKEEHAFIPSKISMTLAARP